MVERIHIDPSTFAITLFNEAGHALPKERLSEGEKQIFAISVLWGLARASAHPLPAIIDTPMARLDAAHRRHLVERYFPHASHQVLILSTDTEVDRHYYQALQPHIARAYHLRLRRGNAGDARRGGLLLGSERRQAAASPGRWSRHEHQASPALDPGQGATDPAQDPDGHRALERPLPLGVLPVAPAASPPAPLDVPADSNVEMTWQVFGGDAHELYLALLKERCERDGLGTSDDVLARQFRLHLHRGIGYLAAPQSIRSISDLIRLASDEPPRSPLARARRE